MAFKIYQITLNNFPKQHNLIEPYQNKNCCGSMTTCAKLCILFVLIFWKIWTFGRELEFITNNLISDVFYLQCKSKDKKAGKTLIQRQNFKMMWAWGVTPVQIVWSVHSLLFSLILFATHWFLHPPLPPIPIQRPIYLLLLPIPHIHAVQPAVHWASMVSNPRAVHFLHNAKELSCDLLRMASR